MPGVYCRCYYSGPARVGTLATLLPVRTLHVESPTDRAESGLVCAWLGSSEHSETGGIEYLGCVALYPSLVATFSVKKFLLLGLAPCFELRLSALDASHLPLGTTKFRNSCSPGSGSGLDGPK